MAASVLDRDGAKRPLLWTRLDHPTVRKIWVGQGLRRPPSLLDRRHPARDLDIVRKAEGQRSLLVQPKRWAVERTFAWSTTRRRLACDAV